MTTTENERYAELILALSCADEKWLARRVGLTVALDILAYAKKCYWLELYDRTQNGGGLVSNVRTALYWSLHNEAAELNQRLEVFRLRVSLPPEHNGIILTDSGEYPLETTEDGQEVYRRTIHPHILPIEIDAAPEIKTYYPF